MSLRCRFGDRDPFPSEGVRLPREFGRIVGDELPVRAQLVGLGPRLLSNRGSPELPPIGMEGMYVASDRNPEVSGPEGTLCRVSRPWASTKRRPASTLVFAGLQARIQVEVPNVPIGTKVEGQQPPWMKSAHKEQMSVSVPF